MSNPQKGIARVRVSAMEHVVVYVLPRMHVMSTSSSNMQLTIDLHTVDILVILHCILFTSIASI